MFKVVKAEAYVLQYSNHSRTILELELASAKPVAGSDSVGPRGHGSYFTPSISPRTVLIVYVTGSV